MAVPPPRLIGIPENGENPPMPRFSAKRRSCPPVTPAPAITDIPSARSAFNRQNRMTTPSNNPSAGKTFAPTPKKQNGMCSRSSQPSNSVVSSASDGLTATDAIPPQPMVVCREKSNDSSQESRGNRSRKRAEISILFSPFILPYFLPFFK